MKRMIVRAFLLAVAVAVVLIAVIVILDMFGSQPQPFQYLLH